MTLMVPDNKLPTYHPILVRLNCDLLSELEERLLQHHVDQGNNYRSLVAFFAGKACKTHKAIVILAMHGYGQDAGILLRSFLNLVINACWISKDPAERVAQFTEYDWILRSRCPGRSADDLARLTDEARRQVAAIDPEIEKKACEAKQKYKYGPRGWSGKTIEKMAAEVGLRQSYENAYRLLSNLEHSNSRSTIAYLEQEAGTCQFNVGPGPEYVREVLATSYILLTELFALADTVLGLDLAQVLEEARRKARTNKKAFVQD